jgi:hypothetical protein
VKHSIFAVLLVAFVASFATACTHVKPYERSKLAHPTMNGVGEPGVAEEHMHGVHEGAQGGSATAESGCGCN